MALRPRLSTGLRLSDFDKRDYSRRLQIFTLHFGYIGLQDCNDAKAIPARMQICQDHIYRNNHVTFHLKVCFTYATLAHPAHS